MNIGVIVRSIINKRHSVDQNLHLRRLVVEEFLEILITLSGEVLLLELGILGTSYDENLLSLLTGFLGLVHNVDKLVSRVILLNEVSDLLALKRSGSQTP